MERITLQSLLRLLLRRARTALTVALALLLAPQQPLFAEGITSPKLKRPGQLVDIGTHLMHIYCRGTGHPAVILDAGLGGISLEWYGVQSALAQYVRTCIYDRAGYGWSYPGPQPRTSSRIADELYLLLNAAKITSPYVLVGHSFGGYNMQLFASRYPNATAGLVLVDSSHADQIQRFLAPPIKVKLAPSIKGKYVITRFSRPKVHPKLPNELKGIVNILLHRSAMRQAMASEYLHFRQSALEVKIAGALPEIPLIVLTRGRRVWPEDHRGDLMEKLWFDLQSELAMQGLHYVQYIANQSGHHIHLDQPRLVIDAIKQVIYTFNYQGRLLDELYGLNHLKIGTSSLHENVQFCMRCNKF